MKQGQIVQPVYPLSGIQELAMCMRLEKYSCGTSMMIVLFINDICSSAPSMDALCQEHGQEKALNSAFVLVFLDGRHRHSTVQMPKDDKFILDWRTILFASHHAVRRGGYLIS